MRKAGGFDEQDASASFSNRLFRVQEQLLAQAAGLRLLLHCDPVKIPGPVGHRCRGKIGESHDSAMVLKRYAMVAQSGIRLVEVVEHFLKRRDLQILEDSRRLSQGQ